MTHVSAVLLGVSRYARSRGPWIIHRGMRGGADLDTAVAWRAAGVIAFERTAAEQARLRGAGLPVVNIASGTQPVALPRVGVDNRAAGRMAAAYLAGRGFSRLAFFCHQEASFATERRDGFVEAAERSGAAVAQGGAVFGADWQSMDAAVGRWLKQLTPPVGIAAHNDAAARLLSETCLGLGLEVPQRYALLGIDNDPTVCDVSHPALSSVELPWERVGYEAARVLDAMMRGEPPPAAPIELPPLRVVERQSTEVMAIDDPDVARALHVIRERGTDPAFSLAALPDAALASRRAIETKMKRLLGRTPGAELRRVRCETAKQLLIDTDLDMPAVARACGFTSAANFGVTFRKEVGQTPTGFRKASRLR